jgi:hypothetical protein
MSSFSGVRDHFAGPTLSTLSCGFQLGSFDPPRTPSQPHCLQLTPPFLLIKQDKLVLCPPSHMHPPPSSLQVLQLAVLSFCFGFGVVYLVIIRDILLGTPPSCNGLLCELLGLPPTSFLANPRLVLIVLALLVCAPLFLLRYVTDTTLCEVKASGPVLLLRWFWSGRRTIVGQISKKHLLKSERVPSPAKRRITLCTSLVCSGISTTPIPFPPQSIL